MIFSSGRPFFSYKAKRKNGSMTTIMQIAAALLERLCPEQEEQRHANRCAAAEANERRLVKLKRTLVFTAFKSFGTGT